MWLTAEPSGQQGEASIPHGGVHTSVEGWGVLEGAGASSDHHLTQGKKAPKMDLFFLSLCPPRPRSKATAGFSAVLRRQSLHSSFYFQTPLSFPGDSCPLAHTSSASSSGPRTRDGSSLEATTEATPAHYRGRY